MNRSSDKKIGVVLITAFLLFSFAGCGDAADYNGIIVGNTEEIAASIRGAMIRRSYCVKVSYDARTSDSSGTEAIIADLVEGALSESSDPKSGDYLRYQYGGYTLTYSAEEGLLKYQYKAEIVPKYYTTAEQEARVDEEILRVIEAFGLDDNASELEKIRCVHDFICDCTSYDTVHRNRPGSGHIQSTAYGALIYGTALCQGYAVLCYRLLKELGVENRIVMGATDVTGSTERHVWNIVRVGDVFYNMDVTLDDVRGSKNWFLKSDETFSADHTRDVQYMTDEFCEEYPMSREDDLSFPKD